ncbi:hypothetical protein N9O19_06890 [Euryarchaeota archaeon]|nr:hypothetical protein [Euryarchaeota archaeon]
MGDATLPRVFENTLLSCDGWEFGDEILNPSTESIDLAINDREDMLRADADETAGQWMGFFRNLSGNHFQTYLSVWTENEPQKSWNSLVLSFLNLDIVYFLDNGTLFDRTAIKNIIVRFLDGDDITQFLPFEATTMDLAIKSKYRYLLMDEATAKLNSRVESISEQPNVVAELERQRMESEREMKQLRQQQAQQLDPSEIEAIQREMKVLQQRVTDSEQAKLQLQNEIDQVKMRKDESIKMQDSAVGGDMVTSGGQKIGSQTNVMGTDPEAVARIIFEAQEKERERLRMERNE